MEVDEEAELSAWGALSMNLRKLASFEFVFKIMTEQKQDKYKGIDQTCQHSAFEVLLGLEGLDLL